MDKVFRLGITGHRPHYIPHYSFQELVRVAYTYLEWYKRTKGPHVLVHLGVCKGWDLACAYAAYCLGLKWFAHIPCINQSEYWSAEEKELYALLVEEARRHLRCFYYSTSVYAPGCMERRDAGIVSMVEEMLAFWNPEERKGGTFKTIQMADAKGIPVVNAWGDYIPF